MVKQNYKKYFFTILISFPFFVSFVNFVAKNVYLRCELTLCNNPAHSEKLRKLDPP